MRVAYGEWTPDLYSVLAQDQLQVAKNILSKTGGYKPMPGLATVNTEVLPFAPKGALRAKQDDGSNLFFAGVEDTTAVNFEIYQFKPTDIGGGVIENRWVDVSKAAGYESILGERCEFTQFGDSYFCVSRANPTQGLNLSTGTVFSDVGSNCPRGSHAATAENFFWVGDLVTNDVGSIRNGVQWSAINDPYNWPQPGTDAATAVLSGRQVFEGDGGPVNAIIAGSEVVAIFQEEAIWRADFVGNDVVWDFDNVEENFGLLIKGAAQAFGRQIFFIAEDGFRLFDYTNSKNIGKGRVNDWFFSNYDADYPDSVSIARDPKDTKIWLSFAATGNSGVPNRVMVYDWVLDNFTYGEAEVHSMIGAGTTEKSLDSADVAFDKDVLEDDLTPGDLNYGDLSFDDRQSGVALRQIGGFDSSFRLATFSGTNLAGVMETGDKELNPGRRSLLSGVVSHIRGADVTMQAVGLEDSDLEENQENPDPVRFSTAVSRDKRSGRHPFHIDAMYHRLRFNLGSNWSEAAYCDIEARATGRM
jgi:hypothetical protein